MNKCRILLGCYLGLSLIATLANAQQALSPASSGAVPQLVSFSGRAVNGGGKIIPGIAGATFAIYKDQYEGAPLWMETQNVQADSKGNFSVQMGTATSGGVPLQLFSSGEARWLGVRINGGEEQPRVLLVSVPYALKAADAQTLGGLPPSAFVLAVPAGATPASASSTASSTLAAVPPVNPAVTGVGTNGAIPVWDGASDIINSVITQTGSGSTARIGINTVTPATTLDVKGTSTFRGMLGLPSSGPATATAGKTSYPLVLTATAFNSATAKSVNQTFRWQTEPVGNDTANASGTLNLLFYSGSNTPTETGLSVASNGQMVFAAGQAFPGTGPGTITGVTAGSGLTGGGTAGAISLSVPNLGITNSMLATPSLTVAAGTDLTGGGSVTLGGTTTLNLDTTKVPQLNAANLFHGDQSVVGNVSVAKGYGFNIGGIPFAFGSATTANVLLGFAGNSTMTGASNTASGYQALGANTAGRYNTASGYQALALNTAGLDNSAIGYQALYANTLGIQNVAVGWSALYSNTTGNQNTASGVSALVSNSTGSSNTASGYTAMFLNTTGFNNTADGVGALHSSGSSSYNTAVGFQSLFSNTGTTNPNESNYNSAFGVQALYSNMTGASNTASGYQAMYFNSSGFFNTATGYQSLYNSNGGNQNTAEGYQALYSDSMGSNNAATGYHALYSNNAGSYNTADGAGALAHSIYANNTGVGYEALAVSTAVDNVAVGYIAAISDTLGDENTAVGSQAMGSNSTGSDITCIGYQCDTGTDALSNATAIGAHAIVGTSNSLVLGGTGKYAVKVGIGTTSPSAILTIGRGAGHPVSDSWETYSSRRWKTNIQTLPDALAKVEQLRGVSYDLKDSGKHEIGVIAEEVGAVVPELVTYEPNGKDARGVDYSRLTALLIEGMKQQQTQIAKQNSELAKAVGQIRAHEVQIKSQQAVMHRQAGSIRALESKLRTVYARQGDGHSSNPSLTVAVKQAAPLEK